jgi:hypothetical protein
MVTNLPNFQTPDKFDAEKGYQVVSFGSDGRLLEVELNELQKIQNHARAEILRKSIHSGVLEAVTVESGTDTPGAITLPKALTANIHGYLVEVPAGTVISLPAPSNFGSRDDLVFLEAWFEDVDFQKDASLIDARIGEETSRRVALKWRIRTVADVDFEKFTEGLGINYPETQIDAFAQGGLATPLTAYPEGETGLGYGFMHKGMVYAGGITSGTMSTANARFKDEAGLYVAGYGDQASKDLLKTADGYVYALPLFRVKRRNAGGYSVGNLNGASVWESPQVLSIVGAYTEGAEATYTIQEGTEAVLRFDRDVSNIFVVGSSPIRVASGYQSFTVLHVDGTDVRVRSDDSELYVLEQSYYPEVSDRPDDKFANIIDKDDIIGLYHRVSLTGENYDKLLSEDFEKLLQGELYTVAKPELAKERFGLVAAPKDVEPVMMPTRAVLKDGTETYLTNLMGAVGDFRYGAVGWELDTPAAASVSTAKAKYGTNSLLMERTGPNTWVHYVIPEIKTGKLYVMVYDAFYETTVPSGETYIELYAKDSYSGQQAIGDMDNAATTEFVPKYVKFQSSHDSPRLVIGGSGVWKAYLDGLRIYEVDQETYDKIDVDPEFTGDALAEKFPYVDTYPHVVENLFDGAVDEGRVNINTGVEEAGPGVVTRNFVHIEEKRDYFFEQFQEFNQDTWGLFYTASGSYIGYEQLYAADSNTHSVFTTPEDALLMKFYTANGTDLNAKFLIAKHRVPNAYVPYGKWLAPTDVTAGQVSTRLSDFSNNRQVFSDAQTTEKQTVFVDAISTVHQPHITATQASEGQWTAGDTIKVKASNGVVHGLIDTDTAIGRVIRGNEYGNLPTIVLDKVDGLEVNDTITIVAPDGTIRTELDAVHTVTAIDTATNEITITQSESWYPINEGDFIVESTASSSSPVVTAAGIAGTWTNLGLNEATYTISTAPTTNTDTLKVEYAVSYPEGKGLKTLPDKVVGATVNGVPYKKSDNLKLLETFEGIDYDTGPHYVYLPTSASAGLTLRAPGDAGWYQFRNPATYCAYNSISKLDGTRAWDDYGNNGDTGYIAQHLFSFDVVGAVERQYGRIPADDLAGKVAWIGANVTRLQFNWHGYGTSYAGYMATLKYWYDGSWYTTGSTTADDVTQLTDISTGNGVSGMMNPDGFIHFLAHSEPSDGVVDSYLYTDYAELEIEADVAEAGYDVFVPAEKKAVSVNAPSFFKQGENMLPPLGGHTSGSINKAVSDYVIERTETGVIEVLRLPCEPNTTYSLATLIDSSAAGGANARVRLDEHDFDGEHLAYGSANYISPGEKGVSSQVFTTGADTTELSLHIQVGTDLTGKIVFSDFMLTPGDKELPFVPYEKPIPKTKSKLDFRNKVAGSALKNPHKAYTRTYASFESPDTLGDGWDGFYENSQQSTYDNMAKLDGTLQDYSTVTASEYAQQLFEFDLSHLGLSLEELKKAVKTLTVNWTGYGVGDNGGVQTHGVTMKWWRTDSYTWGDRATDTASTPTTLTIGDNGYATDLYLSTAVNQKLYVLMHSTYPAGAASPSEVYTDHISLEVVLADWVDSVKKNVIKVRPQTKELKLGYPPYSPATGRSDAVELFYETAPYQGTGVEREGTIVALGDPYKVNGSTGKAVPVNFDGPRSKLRNGELAFLPLLDFEEYAYISEVSYPAYRVKREDVLDSVVYAGFTVGRTVGFGSLVANPTRTLSRRLYLDDADSILAIEQGKAGEIIALPYLVASEEKLFLFVSTAKLNSAGQAYHMDFATDIFEVTGRPLIKGQ